MSHPLPTGTITFLFTDIEGSTARWELDREAMATALRLHDEVSSEAIDMAGGVLFKTTGDGCCAVFSDVEAAVRAAVALRDRLASETWPESVTPLRVRMAVHSGTAEERDGDYFGPTLNRVARIMAAGHGGQILLSETSRDLLADLPYELRDLGEHRLRDLLRSERIYQVDASAQQFPPLRAMRRRSHNLPVQLSPFLGRDRELGEVSSLVRGHRLLTLTGPGGTGKTRLALQAAAESLDSFDDVYFVDLSHISDADHLASAIVDSIGLQNQTVDDQDELLLNNLAERRALIILDNFEHVIEAAPFVGSLLEAAPEIHILATSREALRIRGERHYPVPPLAVPSGGAEPAAEISGFEAVRLFVDRAQAARPDFVLDGVNAQDVAAICRRLDGLPLAIELAAARMRLFTASQLRAQVQAGIGVLAGGPVDSPERHHKLADTIRWSYDLLGDQERTVFARLAVFVGGRSLEGVDEVCLFDLEIDSATVAEALADKSLIRLDQGRDGAVRIQFLSMIYSFASNELGESRDLSELRRRHLKYYVELVERSEAEMRGSAHATWTARLEDERPNLESALAWSFDGGELTDGLRLVAGLRDFWFYQGHLAEMNRWVEQALAQRSAEDPGLKAGVLMVAGFRSSALQDKRAVDFLDEAAELYGEAQDDRHRALALIWAGGDRHGLLGESDSGRERVREGLDLARRCGAVDIVAQGLNMLGEMERVEGHFELARKVQQECLELSTQTGELRRVAMVSNNLGLIAHHLGDDVTADRLIRQALGMALELEFEWLVAYSLMTLAEQLVLAGLPEVGAQLIGAADAYYKRSGMIAQTADAMDDARIRALVASTLGHGRYVEQVGYGTELSLDEAASLVS